MNARTARRWSRRLALAAALLLCAGAHAHGRAAA